MDVGRAALEGLVDRESAPVGPARLTCRLCGAELRRSFADLGMSPLANAYLDASQLHQPERFYPLHAYVCDECFLVQLGVFAPPAEIFSDYAYFSSYSDTWVDHARRYVDHVTDRFGLSPVSQVVEIASNDGYLLQLFVARGIPSLGVEPAANVAAAAVTRGIDTVTEFFDVDLARRLVAEGRAADLVIGNNVLAHVPELHHFVEGIHMILKPAGIVTLEFPHLLRLIEEREFDTIYHEHFSYLSLLAVDRLFEAHGLALFDVEELPTHGGSLRIYVAAAEDSRRESERLRGVRRREREARLDDPATYDAFHLAVQAAKRDLLDFLISARRDGRSIVAYGAAAKGNTLLNYCGVRSDFLDYVVDRSPHKQGLYLPGTHLPILPPERIFETKPDFLLILPWNLTDEIVAQMAAVRDFGCRFVVPIPDVHVIE
jgi:SAM-dependent methyltransferase